MKLKGSRARTRHIRKVQGEYNSIEKSRRSAIRKEISKLEGKRFSASFVCDMCRHTRTVGYLYETEDAEYEICKFCYDALHDVRPSVKLLYTPMGNKR